LATHHLGAACRACQGRDGSPLRIRCPGRLDFGANNGLSHDSIVTLDPRVLSINLKLVDFDFQVSNFKFAILHSKLDIGFSR
jgi:hypothetical protein